MQTVHAMKRLSGDSAKTWHADDLLLAKMHCAPLQEVGTLGKGAQPRSWFRLGRAKPAKPTAVGSYQMKKSEILNRYGEKNV